jgi:membrane-associated phospholipid phosphatase
VSKTTPTRAVAAVLAYAATLVAELHWFGLDLTPERFILVIFAPALVLGVARRFLVDFVPYTLLVLLYEECRGVAHVLSPNPYFRPQLDAEKLLFGGHIPTVELQSWWWDGHLRWHDALLVDVTRVHFMVPPTLAFLLWLRSRGLFYRYAAVFLATSYAGAVTFWLFPAAPPWAAARAHLIPQIARITNYQPQAAPLRSDIGPVYKLFLHNDYAAIPSLHGGYSFIVFLFVAAACWETRRRGLAIALAALYPAAQGLAVVYTGNHYVVDLLVGYVYAGAAFVLVRALWRRKRWPS